MFRRGYPAFKAEVTRLCHSRVLIPMFPGDAVTDSDPAAIFQDNLALYQPIRLVLWSPVEANFANVLRISQVGIEQRQLAGAKMCELRV